MDGRGEILKKKKYEDDKVINILIDVRIKEYWRYVMGGWRKEREWINDRR